MNSSRDIKNRRTNFIAHLDMSTLRDLRAKSKIVVQAFLIQKARKINFIQSQMLILSTIIDLMEAQIKRNSAKVMKVAIVTSLVQIL